MCDEPMIMETKMGHVIHGTNVQTTRPFDANGYPFSRKHVNGNCQGDKMFSLILDNLSSRLGSQHVYRIARSSFQIFVCCGKLCWMWGCCMS